VGQNMGRGGAILTHNELVFPFGGAYVCAHFGKNQSRNAIVRVLADGQTDTLTDANRFYNLSHAIGYAIAMGQIISKVQRPSRHVSSRLFWRRIFPGNQLHWY